jgi:glycosyltransferase involved in cell wall biosynthesis
MTNVWELAGGPGMAGVKVVHLSSHHEPFDNRVFARECQSLAQAGYDVTLIVQHDRDEVRSGVRILGVPRYCNRLERVTRTAFRVFRRALAERADIYHFHDPELIPWAMALRLLGKRVVYDVHEDYAQAAGVRPWLPAWARRLTARFYDLLAALARNSVDKVVIAERYYDRRFPGATHVLNYPRLEKFKALTTIERHRPATLRLLYTGSITASRGAVNHARILRHLPEAELLMIGHCDGETAGLLRAEAGPGARLLLPHVDRWVEHEEIVAAYREPWTCGLAVFSFSQHYCEKELTKFFEYMAAGLPILCSDFPAWRELIEGSGVGLCVDPEDPAAAAAAIRRLHADPALFQAMSEAGRLASLDRFSWSSQARNLVGAYRDLLRERPAVPAPA